MRVGRPCNQAMHNELWVPMIWCVEDSGYEPSMTRAFERVGMATAETLGIGSREQVRECLLHQRRMRRR